MVIKLQKEGLNTESWAVDRCLATSQTMFNAGPSGEPQSIWVYVWGSLCGRSGSPATNRLPVGIMQMVVNGATQACSGHISLGSRSVLDRLRY